MKTRQALQSLWRTMERCFELLAASCQVVDGVASGPEALSRVHFFAPEHLCLLKDIGSLPGKRSTRSCIPIEKKLAQCNRSRLRTLDGQIGWSPPTHSRGSTLGTRSSAGSVFSTLQSAVCVRDNPLIRQLPAITGRSQLVIALIKLLSRGLVMLGRRIQERGAPSRTSYRVLTERHVRNSQ